MAGSGSRVTVVEIVRTLWREFPAMRKTLESTQNRQRVIELLLGLYRAPAHTIDQCMAEVARAGYHIGEYAPTPTPTQAKAPVTHQEEPSAQLLVPSPVTAPTSLHTLAGKLLVAFHTAGAAGLTAEEARVAAGLSVEVGPWKRVSDLHNAGLIQERVDEHDVTMHRPGPAGVPQRVYIITAYGRSVVTMLEGT